MSQEFDSNVLDQIKQKALYPCEYMSSFQKFKGQLSSNEKFYSSLKRVVKSMSMFLRFEADLKWK